ncbi:MAG: hypothetical protein LBU34_11955 [Planctomycetaceae bacterium]|nr:hypothetical protein [Planctomycetaceae bacterium]
MGVFSGKVPPTTLSRTPAGLSEKPMSFLKKPLRLSRKSPSVFHEY